MGGEGDLTKEGRTKDEQCWDMLRIMLKVLQNPAYVILQQLCDLFAHCKKSDSQCKNLVKKERGYLFKGFTDSE